MKTHRELIGDWESRDPSFRAARQELAPEYELRRTMIRARIEAGLSQAELAKKLETSQSAIARLEKGTWTTRVSTLQRLATILDVVFMITPKGPLKVTRRTEEEKVDSR